MANPEIVALGTKSPHAHVTFFTYYHLTCYQFPAAFLAHMARTEGGWRWTEWLHGIGTVKRWARVIEHAQIARETACSECGGAFTKTSQVKER